VLVAGSSTGEPWSIGIVDPDDRDRLLADHRLLGSRRAVATSGSAERGDHIWTRFGSTDVRQATVIADDIVTADVLATAIVAAGPSGLDDVTARFDIDALVVTTEGLLATPRLLVT
jgi:thiamine biosynthesis lipoprotein